MQQWQHWRPSNDTGIAINAMLVVLAAYVLPITGLALGLTYSPWAFILCAGAILFLFESPWRR